MFAKGFARPGQESLLHLIHSNSLAHQAISGNRALQIAAAVRLRRYITNDKHSRRGKKKTSLSCKFEVFLPASTRGSGLFLSSLWGVPATPRMQGPSRHGAGRDLLVGAEGVPGSWTWGFELLPWPCRGAGNPRWWLMRALCRADGTVTRTPDPPQFHPRAPQGRLCRVSAVHPCLDPDLRRGPWPPGAPLAHHHAQTLLHFSHDLLASSVA